MKVYFNSIGQFLEQDTTMDLFVKGNNGNVVECYFNDLDISDTNLKFRLLIKWSDGTTTNELPMNKSLKDEYVYLGLPTLKVEGETQFIIRIYDYDTLQHTSIFERVVLENIDASDDTISNEEYEVLLENIDNKQDVLISGSNIKTINGESIVGSGNIEIKAKDINLDNFVTQDEYNDFKNNVENELAQTTVNVECSHRYEITGATGDEHNLAVGTQQMKINKVSGRTLVRNQLVNPNDFTSSSGSGLIITPTNNGGLSLNGTATDNANFLISDVSSTMDVGRKYLLIGAPQGSNFVNSYSLYLNRDGGLYQQDNGNGIIFEHNVKHTNYLRVFIRVASGVTISNTVFKPQLIDLTLMYGVGNEPTTVEEVLNDFPDYIPYNEGEFVHSNNKLISTGRNLWKYGEQTFTKEKYIYLEEPIKAGVYTISAFVTSTDIDESRCVMAFYSSHNVSGAYVTGAFFERNTRSFQKIVFSKDVYTISLRSAENYNASLNDTATWKDIQIEYGEVATDYEPYKEEVVEVGKLKDFDYIDNQSELLVIGSKVVKMKDLTYVNVNGAYNIYGVVLSDLKKPSSSNERMTGVKSSYYKTAIRAYIDSNMEDKTILRYEDRIVIRDTRYANLGAFQQAMQNSNYELLYELSTPTTIEDVNLPIGMYVTEGGMQIQEGTIPYVIEKEYALSIASQVKANIEFDREQQEQINGLKNFLYQPLGYMQYYVVESGNTELKLAQDMQINLYQLNNSFDIHLEGHKCILVNLTDDEITIYGDVNLMGSATIYNYANIPENRFTAVNQGVIAFEGLQSENIREILIEFVNNCWVIRRVFVGEV